MWTSSKISRPLKQRQRHLVGMVQVLFPEPIIAKNRNTYAKRQREQDKKQRADEKLAKRVEKKEKPEITPEPVPRD